MPTPELHALLSASSAERWMHCTPSARLGENVPENTSEYAEEGRLAHSLAELKFRKLFTPLSLTNYRKELAAIKSDPRYSAEMESCTDTYKQHIEDCALAYNVKPYVVFEQQVDFSAYVPDGFGTSDCILLCGNTLEVFDYKHGKGVSVYAENNVQMMLYAIGALMRYQPFYSDLQEVRLHIIQPRAGGVSTWETNTDALFNWAQNTVAPLAKAAFKGEGECACGDWCRFCPIADTCRSRAEKHEAITSLASYDKLPPVISNTEVGQKLTLLEGVASYYSQLKDFALKEITQGREVPGYKLVAGCTSREWDNQLNAFKDITAAGIAEEMLYVRSPLTVAALEKAIGKKQFNEIAISHVVTLPGKPTLAPVSDNRKEYNSASEDFKNIIKE